MPGMAGCGLSLLTTDGRRITSAGTDPVAERLNALHDAYPENPCTTAWLHRTTVMADRPIAASRWPACMELAIGLGVESLLAAAIATPNRLLGTVWVYSTRRGAFRRNDGEVLARWARAAGVIIDQTQTAGVRGCARVVVA
jgi:GAF domain-containing protein